MTDRALPFAALRAAYEDGRSVAETVAVVRAQIAEVDDPALFIGPLDDRLDARAAQLDAIDHDARAELPLFGVPFVIKGNIDRAGVATTAACPDFGHVAAADGAAVERLLAAGAILVGQTNLDQFATGLVGTRSPYGTPRNALDPARIPGGSSSGSATAVAHGIVPFALGTDTAGSGRVPAAANQVVGLKPTRGLVSTVGVVPACASLDCVSVFATSVADATAVFRVLDHADPSDAWARPDRDQRPVVRLDRLRVGVPHPSDPGLDGLDPDVASSYRSMVDRLLALGATVVPIELGGFLSTGRLLYGGAFVAERYAAVGDFVDANPDTVVPVTAEIIGGGREWSAADHHRADAEVRRLRSAIAPLWRDIDVLALPTVARVPTLDEVRADPVGVNSELGRFTTFTNLLDLAAITVPDPARPAPGAGYTLQGPAGSDDRLATVAAAVLGEGSPAAGRSTIEVAVVGAHLEGQPLNHQLVDAGAALVEATTTASCYRLWALPDGRRPALERTADGAAIEVEVWAVPAATFGPFVALVTPPLGIGTVDLVDGRSVTGFVCEQGGLAGATDVTSWGGWRAWIADRDRTRTR